MEIVKSKEVFEYDVTKYVASDGTEFNDEFSCRAYEAVEKRYEAFEEIETDPELNDCIPFNNGTYSCDINDYYWFRPHSSAEIKLLNEAFPGLSLSDSYLWQWICIEDCDGEYYFDSLDYCLKHIERVLDRLGYKVIGKENEYDGND